MRGFAYNRSVALTTVRRNYYNPRSRIYEVRNNISQYINPDVSIKSLYRASPDSLLRIRRHRARNLQTKNNNENKNKHQLSLFFQINILVIMIYSLVSVFLCPSTISP